MKQLQPTVGVFAAVDEERAERGRGAEAAGSATTAGERYPRASIYCHFGSFAWFVDEDRPAAEIETAGQGARLLEGMGASCRRRK